MTDIPSKLRERLTQFGQEHLLADWDRLTGAQRAQFLSQLEALDLPLLHELYQNSRRAHQPLQLERLAPIPTVPDNHDAEPASAIGADALTRGEVAVVMVAGGQGTRLRSDQPKGMFEIGPVSTRTLFEMHAEQVLARTRRHRCRIPFLIMTSPATDAESKTYFADRRNFGLPAEDVMFFCQGTMPSVDAGTGRLLREAPGRLALSPNGHGGTIAALHEHGLLDELSRRRIRHIYYFQVDNPLVKIADPKFLGRHIRADADVSSKVVPKFSPLDRVGNFVLLDGRCAMIEYSDLPSELAEARDADGRLHIRAGNPAIHIIALEFLRRLVRDGIQLPYHIARKKVKHYDGERTVEAATENALKFEKFIFDTLPLADRWLAVETTHREEFAPLKNMEGPDSPDVVKAAISTRAWDWLERAGVLTPRRDDWPQEISALLALDAEELSSKLNCETQIAGPKFWRPPEA